MASFELAQNSTVNFSYKDSLEISTPNNYL